MMNDKPRGKLPIFIANNIVEDILEASDEEIVNEAQSAFEDVDLEIEKTKKLIQSAVMKSRKQRLFTAKKQLEGKRSSQGGENILTLSFVQKKQLIEQAKQSVPSLTLAARNEEDITETDADGMLQDLIDLDVIDENGNIL